MHPLQSSGLTTTITMDYGGLYIRTWGTMTASGPVTTAAGWDRVRNIADNSPTSIIGGVGKRLL